MRLCAAIILIALFGVVSAQQTLASGYFLYTNITIGPGARIVAGLNTTAPVKLIVMRSSDLAAYANGQSVSTVYSSTVGSGIYTINPAQGSYTVLFQALSSTQIASGAFALVGGFSKQVELNGEYSYAFSVSNYSNVNVTVLSASDFDSDPVLLNMSYYSLNFSGDSNLQSFNAVVNKGTYTLNLTAPFPEQVFINVLPEATLVNPLQNFSYSTDYPIGVVSYGLYNDSGTLVPYQVSTNEIIGTVNITSLAATAANISFAQSQNLSDNGASLQLNVQMNIEVGGRHLVYWLQNVADFNTSQDTFYMIDNIWNNTDADANLTNATLVGGGNVTGCSTCNQTFYADTYPEGLLNYSFPLDLKLVVLENHTASGTVMSFGYQILRNGTEGEQPLVFYDHVLIPGAYNSSILVTPYYYTPSGNQSGINYYSAEFVFCGEGSGSTSYFNSMNASMWIYYSNGTALRPFPTAYTFGYNTAESAENLRVAPYAYGALITTGNPDYSEQIVAPNDLGALALSIANSSQYTAPSTVYTSTVASTFPLSIPSSPSIGNYLDIAIVVLIILIVIVMLLGRKKS